MNFPPAELSLDNLKWPEQSRIVKSSVTGSKRLLLIFGAGAILVAVAFYCRTHTVFTSEAALQSALQEKIPMGSTKAEVQAYANKAGWINFFSSEGAFVRLRAGKDSIPNNTLSWEMGRYFIREAITVRADFEFDQSNQLYEIRVTKAGVE